METELGGWNKSDGDVEEGEEVEEEKEEEEERGGGVKRGTPPVMPVPITLKVF